MTLSAKSSQGETISKEFIVMMAALMSIVAISIDAMLPALGFIGTDLNASYANQTQLIISFVFIGMTIGQLINGPLSDAIGRRNIIFIGGGLYLIGSLICLLATSMEMMLAGRIVQGFGVSGPFIASQSIVRDLYSGRAMARIMSLVMMIFIMVPAIAPAIGQGILAIGSWHYIFGMYILYAIVIIAWVFFRLKETLTPENYRPFNVKNLIDATKTVITNRTTMTYILAMGCVFACLIAYISSIQQIFLIQYDLGNMFALCFGIQALGSAASSLTNAKLVERLGMQYIVVRALLFVIFLSIMLSAITFFTGGLPFWMFFIYGILIFFNVGLMFGNLNALAMEPMGHIAGIAAAIIGAISSIISITCGTIIGQSYDGTTLPLTIGFSILSAVALIIITVGDKAVNVSKI